MQLTTHTDYSLRLLMYLAIHRGKQPPTVQDAADRYRVSAHHMAKVAQTLVQLGYIHSHRGRGGGLELALAAEQINIGSVVRQVENLQLLDCFGPNTNCPIEPACQLKRALHEAFSAFLDVLGGYTLSDLIRNKGSRLHKLLDAA